MTITHAAELVLVPTLLVGAGALAFTQAEVKTALASTSFTSEQILLILGAVGVLIATITTSVVTVLGAIRANTIATLEAKKEAAIAATAAASELAKIGAHVDGMNTKSVTTIELMQQERAGLIAQLADAEKRAAVLAASRTAVEMAAVSASPAANGSTANGHLEGIDKNTHQIEKNTARTEVIVKDTNALVHNQKD